MFLPRYVGSGNNAPQEKSYGPAEPDEFVTPGDDSDALAVVSRRAVTCRFESEGGRSGPAVRKVARGSHPPGRPTIKNTESPEVPGRGPTGVTWITRASGPARRSGRGQHRRPGRGPAAQPLRRLRLQALHLPEPTPDRRICPTSPPPRTHREPLSEPPVAAGCPRRPPARGHLSPDAGDGPAAGAVGDATPRAPAAPPPGIGTRRGPSGSPGGRGRLRHRRPAGDGTGPPAAGAGTRAERPVTARANNRNRPGGNGIRRPRRRAVSTDVPGSPPGRRPGASSTRNRKRLGSHRKPESENSGR
ncbi:hypothetical protein UG55_103195 [Frankia sp. EI5c]|nr:hypothetical protein UG55_103195 [Frankia sp. EI5c]